MSGLLELECYFHYVAAQLITEVLSRVKSSWTFGVNEGYICYNLLKFSISYTCLKNI
jgi:hypothetical protein